MEFDIVDRDSSFFGSDAERKAAAENAKAEGSEQFCQKFREGIDLGISYESSWRLSVKSHFVSITANKAACSMLGLPMAIR